MSNSKEWSGSPCPKDPDNFWIDDETDERVDAHSGARMAPAGDIEKRREAVLRAARAL